MKSAKKRGLLSPSKYGVCDQVGWNRGNNSSRPYVCTAGMGGSFLFAPKMSC